MNNKSSNGRFINSPQWQLNGSCRVAFIGECMVELTEPEPENLQLNFAGDSLNTAVYFARELKAFAANIDYVTAVGTDPLSDQMLNQWRQEGLGVKNVARIADKLPGLYWVRANSTGERSFYYWRDVSAARELMRDNAELILYESLKQHDVIYLTGISIAILDIESRTALLNLLGKLKKRGALVMFDSNYRPLLWDSKNIARRWIERVLALVDVAMVSFDDERDLYKDSDPHASVERIHSLGVAEVVVKNGAEPCVVSRAKDRHEVAAMQLSKQLDTTAAGDSFNAAYMAARIQGRPIEQAALQGHALAGRVVQLSGAIIPAADYADEKA
ncbi:MAG: sugar kinase [Arenicella sp.]|nr:sugar kinase [Arenicella sp.]